MGLYVRFGRLCGVEVCVRVFVYKMFGLLESTMDKTRQSPYLLMLLLVSSGGCPLFKWGVGPVLMSWFLL